MVTYDPKSPEPFIRKAFADVLPSAVHENYIVVRRPSMRWKAGMCVSAVISLVLLAGGILVGIPGFAPWGAMIGLGAMCAFAIQLYRVGAEQSREERMLSDLLTLHPELVRLVTKENQAARAEAFSVSVEEMFNELYRQDEAAARERLHEREL